MPRFLLVATIGIALALALRPAALSNVGAPNGAAIRFEDVNAIYVREHDDTWTTWISGAPEIVNRDFLDAYATRFVGGPGDAPAATSPPTPTQPRNTHAATPATPTAPAEATGFNLAGTGSTVLPLTAAGRLVCDASVSGNVRFVRGMRIPQPFGVVITGEGVRRLTGVIHGHEVYRAERSLARITADAYEGTSVVFLGDGELVTQRFRPPYKLHVRATGSWAVACRPVTPLPAARGFSIIGRTSGPVVWGEDTIPLDPGPTGLLSCEADWFDPVGWESAASFQWTIWGHDETGERVRYGYEQPHRIVLRQWATVWLGDERPGEHVAFLPPYSIQAVRSGTWTIDCTPKDE